MMGTEVPTYQDFASLRTTAGLLGNLSHETQQGYPFGGKHRVHAHTLSFLVVDGGIGPPLEVFE